MSETGGLLLSFYGDDFTGSTDAMEALSLRGVRTALFLDPPSRERALERFPDLQVIGVAGVSRTMTPAQMDAALPPAFERMRQLGAPLFHYKICSTFDSSPEVGSIGRAIDIGREVFDGSYVPLVVGAPVLRRYCLFGNLFATVDGETFRLDRHPTMRSHPVTPMRESDLRVHLSHQTGKRVGLLDILHLSGGPARVDANLARVLESKPDVVLFDVLDEARLAEVGRLLWQHRGSSPAFVVGSSGVGYALTAHWRETGRISPDAAHESPGPVDQVLVVSGSCSPVTGRQIEWAADRGFASLALDTVRLIDPDSAPAERAAATRRAAEWLAAARSVVLHSAVGPNDPRIEATAGRLGALGGDPQRMRERLGVELGKILRALLEQTKLRRVIVAGGDTSGHAARELGIQALTMLAPTAPGSPLCRAHSDHASTDGLEIVLKGGQVGGADYFELVRQGAP